MEQNYITEQTYNTINYTEESLLKGEYENCTFSNCDFSHSDISQIKFIDCLFSDCNLSNADLSETSLQNIKFKDCKMQGLYFEKCYAFGFSVRFENCLLNHSSFYRVDLSDSSFSDTNLKEVDFTDSNCNNITFENCDMHRAIFDHTILENADLKSAVGFSIDPEINRIKGAKFSLAGIAGLLNKYDINIEI